jgi:SAM-dependent methyltransferase
MKIQHAAWLRLWIGCAVLGAGLVLHAGPAPQGGNPQTPEQLAPYVPTPQDIVERMLAMADVTSADVVYDLGSGDGRIPITAAKKYGARAVGVEIDSKLVNTARARARSAGVETLVTFVRQDLLTVDLSGASVVTLYLVEDSNLKIRRKLTTELKAGARIVSHAFAMGDWKPDKIARFESGFQRFVFLWVADGRLR